MKVTLEINGVQIASGNVEVESIKIESEYTEEEYTAALAAIIQALQQLDPAYDKTINTIN